MPLIIGPAVAAGGFALLAVPGIGGSYWTTFFPAVVGAGPRHGGERRAADDHRHERRRRGFAGAASGINNAVSRVAALFAVALFGLIMASIFNGRLHGELERAAVTPNLIEAIEQQRNKLAAIDVPAGVDALKQHRRKAQSPRRSSPGFARSC